MNPVNQKIIQAIIDKANRVCPDALALIGVYGSADTEDEYEKSDLDLLILIENDEGWKLGTGFILEDRKVGYDLYCTTRSGLKEDAECHHARLSKLMDSRIVYVRHQDAYDELLILRARAKQLLSSEERFQRVHEAIDQAKMAYANACLRETLGQVRLEACGVITYLSDAAMLYHGKYFRRGVKRTLEELAALPIDDAFVQWIRKAVVCKEIDELRGLLKQLILYAESYFRKEKPKEKPSESLSGTYEEMVSNWRNKVEEAAKNGDAFASFMNLGSFQWMLSDIAEEVEIGSFPVMEEFDPDSLEKNVEVYDCYLQQYEQVCHQAGIRVRRYAGVDEFAADYLRS
ncbi:MAG: hypothetical protein J5794_01035 [Lachnospiraceae bacterium]|nr:hypothetical protein [Lachnospiraceae bacterium]